VLAFQQRLRQCALNRMAEGDHGQTAIGARCALVRVRARPWRTCSVSASGSLVSGANPPAFLKWPAGRGWRPAPATGVENLHHTAQRQQVGHQFLHDLGMGLLQVVQHPLGFLPTEQLMGMSADHLRQCVVMTVAVSTTVKPLEAHSPWRSPGSKPPAARTSAPGGDAIDRTIGAAGVHGQQVIRHGSPRAISLPFSRMVYSPGFSCMLSWMWTAE